MSATICSPRDRPSSRSAAAPTPTRTTPPPTATAARHSPSSCSSTATPPRRPRSSPARCRITIAPSSSAKPPSARAWCRPSTTSAKTPAWRSPPITTTRRPGRLIQRNYTGVSLYDYYYNHAGALPSNSTNHEVKLTDSGRTVYGGGGITPDEKIETPQTNHFQEELLYKDVFFHFAPVYVATHTVDKNFQVDDAVLADFKKYLTSQNVEWTDADIDGVTDWIKTRIKEKIVTIQFGQLQGLRALADWDPEIQKAVTYLPEAQALEDNAHKVLTEKAMARNAGTQGVPMQPRRISN